MWGDRRVGVDHGTASASLSASVRQSVVTNRLVRIGTVGYEIKSHFLRPWLNDGGREEHREKPTAPVPTPSWNRSKQSDSFKQGTMKASLHLRSVQKSWPFYTATPHCHPRHVGARLGRWGLAAFPRLSAGHSGMPVQRIPSQSLCCCGPKMNVNDAINKCAQTRAIGLES